MFLHHSRTSAERPERLDGFDPFDRLAHMLPRSAQRTRHRLVPRTGRQLPIVGDHFDALRVRVVRGEAVLHHPVALTDAQPGPDVREISGGRWTYFLLAPGEGRVHPWPPGPALRAGPGGRHVGAPAREGDTYALSWRCGVPGVGDFVAAEPLRKAAVAQLTAGG